MPSKKKKYNARFPAGRIKKIMQTDEEVGKVAQAVPIIISRTLELFVESLLIKSCHITRARNAKTLTPSHMKQCILSESRFDFLRDLVKNIPDASAQEDNENNILFDAMMENKTASTSSATVSAPNLTSVIRFGPNESSKRPGTDDLTDSDSDDADVRKVSDKLDNNVPSLISISSNFHFQTRSDLVIDEDYDN